MKKWIIVVIALSVVALYGLGRRQMVTIGWDPNPAATSYNCYLDGVRVATHVSDALRCTMRVSVGMHTVSVTSVRVVACGSDGGACDEESPRASLKFVKLPFLRGIPVR